jgi:hypothetical protein
LKSPSYIERLPLYSHVKSTSMTASFHYKTSLMSPLFTEVPVWSHDRRWSCICVLEVSIFLLSKIFFYCIWNCFDSVVFFCFSIYYICCARVRVMVCNSFFNNISVISWRSVWLLEETGVPREIHRSAVNHWQTSSHNGVSSTPRLSGIQIHNLIGERYWSTR